MMNLQDCVQFANENPIIALATVEGNQARVRNVQMFFADATGFYLALLSPKEVVKQIKANPKVELCFFHPSEDMMQMKQMRVTGSLELVNDEKLIKRCAQERAGLSELAGKPIDPFLVIYRLSHGVAHFWTLMDVLKEPTLEKIHF
jgi:pyridoxamine 5'-phosphate oxidase